MMDTNEKLSLFLEAIREAAEESCRETEQQTAAYTRDQLAQAEKEVHDRHEIIYQNALRSLRQQADSQLSAYRATARGRLTRLRAAYEQSVFGDAAKAIAAFTATEAYGALLERSAAKLAALAQRYAITDAVLYLRPADAAFAPRVQAVFGSPCTVQEDDGIRLGGLRLESAQAHLSADDTLETRLEQQKPYFRRSAGLSVL